MTDYQIWSLVIGGLTAVGTVGAVVTSLWLSFRSRKAFEILSVEAVFNHTINADKQMVNTENLLVVTIKNMMDFPMHVKGLRLNYSRTKKKKALSGKTGHGLFFDKMPIIPPHSQYPVYADIFEDQEPECFNANRIVTCEVVTNFGEKSIRIPSDWQSRIYEVLTKKEALKESA